MTEKQYPKLPNVGPIGYASVVDIERYETRLSIGPHLPGVRDVALWTTDQMRAFANATCAMRAAQAAPASQDAEDALMKALERAYSWMDSQADTQSKGGHATFDLMMLREERNAAKAAIDAARAKQEHKP